MYKKLILWTVIIAAGVVGTACTPEEIGAGAIGVGIGIGIGRHHDRHHGDRHHRRPPRRHCDYRGCWDGMDQVYAAQDAKDSQALATRYQIPVASAAKITQAFVNSESQGLDAFRAMGLSNDDFKALMNQKLPSQQAVESASAKLNLSQDQGRNLLTSMMREFRSQANDINSEYWQYCTSEGSWKTDQNRYCTQTYWNGCSPETGAKFCY